VADGAGCAAAYRERLVSEERRTEEPDELPPPTFRQALVGYGSIFVALVLLALLLGVLMRVLR
jgi:hypothetical protein